MSGGASGYLSEDKGEVTKEFPKGKENYCPACYFDGGGVLERGKCDCDPVVIEKRKDDDGNVVEVRVFENGNLLSVTHLGKR